MSRGPRAFRKVVFALIPVVALVACAEVGLRACGLDQPAAGGRALPEEQVGLIEADAELLWASPANVRRKIDVSVNDDDHAERARGLATRKVSLTTNAQGLRSPALSAKVPGEVRILSLGESTTFGVGVGDGETYSALLEGALNEADRSRRYRVLNAGVAAYSTFQSYLYLKKRGPALKADVVLFYHEFNDHLPSSIRARGAGNLGVPVSDKELYNSTRGRVSRLLTEWSATYRFASYRLASFKLSQVKAATKASGSDGALGAQFKRAIMDTMLGEAHKTEASLPMRGPPAERKETLRELAKLCRARGIKLVVIHPAYQFTARHQCVLTRLCRELRVPMVEAFDVLHRPGQSLPYIQDGVHPTRRGHRWLAEALFDFLVRHRMVPAKHPPASK